MTLTNDWRGSIIQDHLDRDHTGVMAGVANYMYPAKVDLLGQLAPISTTTMYIVPVGRAGMYRISSYLDTSFAGSSGTAAVVFGWNDGNSAETFTSSNINLNQSSYAEVDVDVFIAEGQAVTYAVTMAGQGGNPKYDLHIRLMYQG